MQIKRNLKINKTCKSSKKKKKNPQGDDYLQERKEVVLRGGICNMENFGGGLQSCVS